YLAVEGYVYKDGMYWFYMEDREHFSVSFLELEPDEAAILYVMARTFVKQSDRRDALAQAVLLKMANIMQEDLLVSFGEHLTAAARELATQPEDADYEDVLRQLLRGYIYRRKLELIYHPYDGNEFKTIFSPYLIEPSGFGHALYVIGHSSIVDDIRTYKVDRIRHVRLRSRDQYTLPDDFPGLELLNNAFSIYHGEETIHVVLRFDSQVARRVKESNWHRSARFEWDSEKPGHLLLHMDIADTTDLEPWIRGWGASCEVLEPVSLRQKMLQETQKLMHLYELSAPSDDVNHDRFKDIFGD
ncbi:MAG: hypothetical protein CUN55_15875, partial [Phototrophicales bacterium]